MPVRMLTGVVLLVLLAVLPSCATTPVAGDDPLAGIPEDLTLDVTVLRGPDAPVLDKAHRRGARYVLLSDGTLHHAAAARRGADWLPPPVRTLNRAQVAAIWTLAGQLGFADPDAGALPTNPAFVAPPSDGVTCFVQVRANGRRWQHERTVAGDAPFDPASVALVRRLADLAWASDLPETTVRVQPRRYDFGPDPYARYRR